MIKITAVTPDVVMKKPLAFDNMYGTTPRKLVSVYVECSPAAAETLNLATYVPGLSAIAALTGFSTTATSIPTFSGTTLTFVAPGGAQKHNIIGYY